LISFKIASIISINSCINKSKHLIKGSYHVLSFRFEIKKLNDVSARLVIDNNTESWATTFRLIRYAWMKTIRN
jgi:hypothetical protein